ncbi:CAAX amino terminal protease self- immunity [Aedoeadaptatus ivorii]|uniref:CAAX amino terminal protease self- immunity n=1 Tax=Aedoeadaptatus ivorii TaxID=54006 RepID=A0A3S4Z3Z5_9FIRM|nr:type II CAAX endopeptidase family protein [Peptoniphilus ivorii]VEJ35819.1 CAAX amino terminal protease self- immunity [Peptoniphilus ivorii]
MDPITETNPTSIRTKKIKYLPLLYVLVACAVVFLATGPVLGRLHPLWGIVATECIAIAVPAFVLRTRLPLYRPKRIGYGEVVVLTLAVFPIILLINGLFLDFLSEYVVLQNRNLEILREQEPLWVQLLTLAAFPAVFEELLFRGVVCEVFSRRNPLGGVVFSAALFALFHFSLQNSLAPFLFGLVLGHIYLHGGLLPSILSHFVYNVASVLLIRLFNEEWITAFSELTRAARLGGAENGITLILILCCVLSLILILRRSRQRPPSGGEKLLRNKEPIPVLLLTILYLIAIFL